MKQGSHNSWAMIYVDRAMLDNFIEFNELDREVLEFLEVPNTRQRMTCWQESCE